MKISYRWQFAISTPVLRINGPGWCASGSPIGWKRVYTVHKRIFNAFHRLRSRSLRRVEQKPWTNHVSWEIFWFYMGGATFLRFARTKGNEMKKRNDRRFVGKQDFPSALWFNPLALSFFSSGIRLAETITEFELIWRILKYYTRFRLSAVQRLTLKRNFRLLSKFFSELNLQQTSTVKKFIAVSRRCLENYYSQKRAKLFYKTSMFLLIMKNS